MSLISGPGAPAPGPQKNGGRWWKIAAGVVAVLFVIGVFNSGDESSPSAAGASGGTTKQGGASAPAEIPAKPTNPYGPQPKDQLRFLKAVAVAQDAAANADNDLQRGAALSKRNQAVCQIVGAGTVRNWAGKVTLLDANGDGKGVLTVEMAEDVTAATWNNAFSDIGDNTLIEPGALFDKVLALKEGDVVRFSGKLLDDGDACVDDSRLTLDGKLSDPEFIFRFSDVARVH